MQLVHLLHDPGKGDTPAAVVADIVEDAPEALGQRIIAQAFFRVGAGELGPEFAIDKLQHLVGVVSILGPGGPGVFAGKAALIGFIIKGGLFLAPGFGFVEGLEKKQPGELLHIVAGVHAFLVELVAGVLDDLLHFLAAMVDLIVHVIEPSLIMPSWGHRDAVSPLPGLISRVARRHNGGSGSGSCRTARQTGGRRRCGPAPGRQCRKVDNGPGRCQNHLKFFESWIAALITASGKG